MQSSDRVHRIYSSRCPDQDHNGRFYRYAQWFRYISRSYEYIAEMAVYSEKNAVQIF